MKKISKFLVCENPLTRSHEYILHTRVPRFLSRVYLMDNEEDQTELVDELMKAQENDGGALIISKNHSPANSIYFVIVCQDIYDNVKVTQDAADELAKIVRRKSDWYRQILIKEMNN